MIGIGSPPYRDLDSVPDAAKLAFSGLMAPQAKIRLAAAQPHRRTLRRRRSRSTSSSAHVSYSRKASARASDAATAGSAAISWSARASTACRTSSASASSLSRWRTTRSFLPTGERCEPLADAGVLLYRRAARLGRRAGDPGRRDRAGAARRASASSAGRAGWRRTGPRPTCRTDADARFHPAEILKQRRAPRVLTQHSRGDRWPTSVLKQSPASSTGSATRPSSRRCARPRAPATATSSSRIGSFHILQKERTDIALTADHFKLDRAKLLTDLGDGGRRLPQERDRDAGDLQPRSSICSTAAGTTRRCSSARRRSAPAISWSAR